ncbi:MAG: uracil-DNA glycosylase [Actinomycetota bacterium]|jgi:uracil-DNA glycosylase|nr:uracil-DNA glycosylase [Actinomycetota bacterium]
MLTWRNLYRVLDAADLDSRECFFTDAYVGLKAGDEPTGRFPGAGDSEFRAWCRSFLEDQIELMRPRVVATLGNDARRFVAALAPSCPDGL